MAEKKQTVDKKDDGSERALEDAGVMPSDVDKWIGVRLRKRPLDAMYPARGNGGHGKILEGGRTDRTSSHRTRASPKAERSCGWRARRANRSFGRGAGSAVVGVLR